jgi:hypothetical protein
LEGSKDEPHAVGGNRYSIGLYDDIDSKLDKILSKNAQGEDGLFE